MNQLWARIVGAGVASLALGVVNVQAGNPLEGCFQAGNIMPGDMVMGSTVGIADPDPLAINCNLDVVSGGHWYMTTGTGDIFIANTCSVNAMFDTKLTVYEGDCNALVCVDGNNDRCGLQSEVLWLTDVGTTYFIFVSGSSAVDEGQYELSLESIAVPANDDACDAMPLMLGETVEFSNIGATVEAGEPSPGEGTGEGASCNAINGWCSFELNLDNSVWFTFVAPPSGTVRIITDGADTQVALWDVVDCMDFGSFVEVGANDDGGSFPTTNGLAAVLEPVLCLTPGAQYYVQVDGFSAASAPNLTILIEDVLGDDCNSNGVNDLCDLDPTDPDGNGIVSEDVNLNEFPDECEGPICPATAEVIVRVMTDNFPSETTWEIVDVVSNAVVASVPQGTYSQSSTLVELTAMVSPSGCYEFTIFDSFGDGICCTFGNGFYEVEYNGEIVASGGEFGSSETSSQFGGCDDFEDCNENCIDDAIEVIPEFDADTLMPVGGDTCVEAEWICPGAVHPSDTFTTADDSPLWCGLYFGGYDVWYKYRPNAAGYANISIADASPTNWVVVVYDDCPSQGGAEVSCNSSGAPYQTFLVKSGRTYWIGVAARYYERDAYSITVAGPDCLEAPIDRDASGLPDECECLADVNNDGVVDGLDFIEVMSEFGPCVMCENDVDGNGVIDVDDLKAILNALGDCAPVQMLLNPAPAGQRTRGLRMGKS
ncbi:MAG: hypothetical protein AAF432_08755 [Planctomycetota bacterium]